MRCVIRYGERHGVGLVAERDEPAWGHHSLAEPRDRAGIRRLLHRALEQDVAGSRVCHPDAA